MRKKYTVNGSSGRHTVYQDVGVPILSWDSEVGAPAENAMEQLYNVANLKIVGPHVAVMPDCHWGMGATIGSVIPTKGGIIPAAVGVDIGCGMCAQPTGLSSDDIGDNAQALFDAISAVVPHGRTGNGNPDQDRGAWSQVPEDVNRKWIGVDCPAGENSLRFRFKAICEDDPELAKSNHLRHLGTLGTGNHFIELCLDKADRVWVMLHSGSRGVGNKIAQHFIRKAKGQLEEMGFLDMLPHPDLAFIMKSNPLFARYWRALEWAQDFAAINRSVMMDRTLRAVWETLPVTPAQFWSRVEDRINCHHNYTALENHFGENLMITRKGAVRARERDMGIIPGSMGTRSFIVRGLGNPDSFHSCSHGAGRVMSRTQARKTISVEEHQEATEGVTCLKGESVLDESPRAYKDIDAVMASQSDLVEIVHELKQFVYVKGESDG